MSYQDLLETSSKKCVKFKRSDLLKLSGITSGELSKFKEFWRLLSLNRREEILDKIIEIGEDNIEFDFFSVLQTALGDDEASTRKKAVRGLSDYEDRTIISSLIYLIKEDPSVMVRAEVALTLSTLANMSRDGKLREKDSLQIKDSLIATIFREKGNVEVMRRSIETVSVFDFPEVSKAIRNAHQHPDLRLRQSSLYAMGESFDTKWLPTVLADTDHDHPAIRFEAANALGKLGKEDTLPDLIKLIQDEDIQVQVAAIRSIGEIGGDLAKAALEKCLILGEETIIEEAASALQAIEFDMDPLSFEFKI